MNERFIESRKAIANAREALKKGDMTEARQWAERAAELFPQSEDPWLILAAVVSPRDSMKYARKALELNPDSPRAKKGVEWATQRLDETPRAGISPEGGNHAAPMHSESKKQVKNRAVKSPKKRSPLLPILLILMGCAVFAFAAWSAVTSPVLASILNMAATPQVAEKPPFAQVNIAKPAAPSQPMVQAAAPTVTVQPMATETETVEAEPESATLEPTLEVAVLPTETQSTPPTAAQPEVTSEPGAVSAEIVADTPTPEFTEPTVAPYVPPDVAGADGEHWIDVNLSQQRLYAYAGDTLMNSFIVSTGTWQTPTVTGKFKIWIKVRSQAMTGPGYYLPDVPYVMYFYKDYGLHGTYWHNNFGTPMSHGCVNLTIPDAEWLYNFASVGTVVNVHD
jgi:lipoprotein-anchoring transpeptidase ErfK/SrfK